jgi:hypothetical protein
LKLRPSRLITEPNPEIGWMSKPRQLLKSIEPRADESIQSIAMRLAPLALVTANELLRYGLDHAAGLASLSTDTNAVLRLGELGGFTPTEMMSRAILPGKLGYMIFEREVPVNWVNRAVRRLAPGVLRDDGDTPFHGLSWQLTALDCDVATGGQKLRQIAERFKNGPRPEYAA